MNIAEEIETMTSEAFNKAMVANAWTVFTKADLDAFMHDILIKGTTLDIEKAKKDISQLVQKRIVDSIGRSKLVWVKRNTDILKPNHMKDNNQDDSVHSQALARHYHNTRVQRMGKESSYKQIERHFGKEIADKVRESNVLSAAVDAKNKAEGILEYKTPGGNKIRVHDDAISNIKFVLGKAGTQSDIENAKTLFSKYATGVKGYPEKHVTIAFHKYLKDGAKDQSIPDTDGSDNHHIVDVHETMLEAKKANEKSANAKVEKTINDKNLESKIKQYVSEMVVKMTSEGIEVDTKWREGLANNFRSLAEYIKTNDFGMLKEMLVTRNTAWRDFYEQYTGNKLPNTDRDTAMFLFRKTNNAEKK